MQVGKAHPGRDEIFQFINDKAAEFIRDGEPVISTDTKKKELIGNFKNNGQEYREVSDPRLVLDHDFAIPELGKVAPTEYMYSTTIQGLSTLARIMIPVSLLWKAFADGSGI